MLLLANGLSMHVCSFTSNYVLTVLQIVTIHHLFSCGSIRKRWNDPDWSDLSIYTTYNHEHSSTVSSSIRASTPSTIKLKHFITINSWMRWLSPADDTVRVTCPVHLLLCRCVPFATTERSYITCHICIFMEGSCNIYLFFFPPDILAAVGCIFRIEKGGSGKEVK